MSKPLLLSCRQTLIALLFLLSTGIVHRSYGQQPGQQQRNCSAMEVLEQQLAASPERAKALKAVEHHTSHFIASQQQALSSSTLITIPVVVHVVYNSSSQNISDAQIRSQIQVLTEDFRRKNADADSRWSQAADMLIAFRLATVDPSGNATKGITRTYTPHSSFSTNDAIKFSSQGGKDAWPADSYLNIWVGKLEGNVLGYAQFPGGPAATDGVVLGYTFFGTSGTAAAPFHLGRSATHEVGHWLNLRHIWGDGDCSADDHVEDTPPAASPSYGCALDKASCDGPDMVQNYMDYSDDACMNLFTAGQKARMRALFAPGGARASLLASAGLGSTSSQPAPSCTENALTLTLKLDNYPSETSWQLKNSLGSTVASGGKYSSSGATITENFCLPAGCYTFIISDAFGDGICCAYGNGSYSLKDAAGSLLASGGSFGKTESKTICLGNASPATCPALDFRAYSIRGFAGHDYGTHQVQDGGSTLYLSGNTWKQIAYNYTVTPATVLEFEFRSSQQGEIQGIAFENDNSISPELSFRVYGTQNWGIGNYDTYTGTSWKKYTIPVGSFYTGAFSKLVFIGDDDAHARQAAYFRHVKIYEGNCGTTRLADMPPAEAAMLGTEAEEAFGLLLYPNPGRELVQLELRGEQSARAELYDLKGRLLWQGRLAEGKKTAVAVGSLAPGIYSLRVIGESGQQVYQKFVKQ
jgi:hypothetical protein